MYLATFLVSVSLIAAARKNRRSRNTYRICVGLALLLPALLAGLRDFSIGNDVLLYGNYWFERAVDYNSFADYIKKAMEYHIEPGYAAVNYMVSRVSSNAHIFYFVYALLQMIVLHLATRDYGELISIPFAYFVYFFTYYNSSLNILRQIMAILIVMFSYKYVIRKQLVKFIICVTLATSFHISAIVAIILYPINWAIHSRLRKMWKGVIIGGSLALTGTYGHILNGVAALKVSAFSRYAHYLADDQGGGRFIRFGFWALFAVLYYVKRKRIKAMVPKYELFGYCLLFSLVASVINFFSGAWLIRIIYYFDCISVISFPLITETINIRGGIGKLKSNYIVIGAIILAYWFIVYILRNGAATFPYQFMKF